MNKKWLALLAVILLMTMVITVSACGKKTEEPGNTETTTEKPVPTKTLKVGLILPMSGPASQWGISIQKDTDAYAAVINDDGGLKIGDEYYNVEVFYGDDEGTPDNATIAAQKLIEKDGVSAILGYWGFGLPAISNLSVPNKVISIVTNTATYDSKTMPYTAFNFDASHVAYPQFEAILKYFPSMKKMAISADEVYIGSVQPALDSFKETLAEKGIGFFVDTYPWGTLDYTQHIEKLHKEGVDVAYSWSGPEPEAMKQKQIYQQKYDIKFVGAGTIPDLKTYIEMAGYEAAQGGLHPHDYPWDFKEVKVAPEVVKISERIRDKHKEMYNEEMGYSGAFPYGLSSMLMYFEAMQKAGTTDADAVMEVIEGGTFDLFSGTYTLGGAQTVGRAVVAPTTGPMGAVKGDKMELVVEPPAYSVP
ncbi:MAG: ABC transporter substrate-binding protein [Bacillota bacterium]